MLGAAVLAEFLLLCDAALPQLFDFLLISQSDEEEAVLFPVNVEGEQLSKFQSHPAGLMALLNDSAHYFWLYSGPLHAALPDPDRIGSGFLSVLVARAWHVFNKPLEPEWKMKSQAEESLGPAGDPSLRKLRLQPGCLTV